jgi:hypothetical protein
MSACPQTHPSPPPKRTAPKPRITRYYRDRVDESGRSRQMSEEEVANKVRTSTAKGYMPRAWQADELAICRGLSQAAILRSIFWHTHGAFHTPEYTPPMLPWDIAAENGFSEREIYDQLDDLVDRQAIARECGCRGARCESRGHYQYKLLTENWPNLRLPPRKPVESEAKGEGKGNAHCGPAQRNDLAPLSSVVIHTEAGNVVCRNLTSGPAAVQASSPRPGEIQVDLLPPLAAAQPRAAPAPMRTASVPAPMASPPPLKVSADPAVDPLVAGLAKLGYPLGVDHAKLLYDALAPCTDLDFFLRVFTEEVERGRRKHQPLLTSGLIIVARNAAARWPAELANRRAFDAEQRQSVAVDTAPPPRERTPEEQDLHRQLIDLANQFAAANRQLKDAGTSSIHIELARRKLGDIERRAEAIRESLRILEAQ